MIAKVRRYSGIRGMWNKLHGCERIELARC